MRVVLMHLAVGVLGACAFLLTMLASTGLTYWAALAVFYPEQTEFAPGTVPRAFLVAAATGDAAEPYTLLGWDEAAALARREPKKLHLDSAGTGLRGWRYKVLGEADGGQTIEAWYRETAMIRTRYRVERNRIVPLSYRTDGGIGSPLNLIMIPVLLAGIWLGIRVSGRVTRAARNRWEGEACTASPKQY